MTRIVGFDPGLQSTGWGIIDADGHRIYLVSAGVIRVPATFPMSSRLAVLFNGLKEMIDEWHPQEAAVEEAFLNTNPHSTMKLCHARAVAILVPAMAGIGVNEYSAKTVKKALTGTGQAKKEQVALMVQRLLPKASVESRDASDALALAICHAHCRKINRLHEAVRACESVTGAELS